MWHCHGVHMLYMHAFRTYDKGVILGTGRVVSEGYTSARSTGARRSGYFILVALLSFMLAAPLASASPVEPDGGYRILVGGDQVRIEEGESVTFDLEAIPEPGSGSGGVSPQATYQGKMGTLTVTGNRGSFVYSIKLAVQATSFNGQFGVTDLTSGLSGGSTRVTKFSGSVATSGIRGHQYAGSLSGVAYQGTKPVARTVSNYTVIRA